MWVWILTMVAVIILAVILGFTGLVTGSAVLAKALFLVLLVAFLATVVMGISRRA